MDPLVQIFLYLIPNFDNQKHKCTQSSGLVFSITKNNITIIVQNQLCFLA
jgi:hypothetical protein